MARKYKCFAVEQQGKKLLLAMTDPTDVFALDDLKLTLGCEIIPAITTEDDFKQIIETFYGMAGSMEDAVKDLEVEIEEEDTAEEGELAMVEDAPIVRLVNLIITQAVKERASDIHIEPGEKELVIRYRVDGRLRQVMTSPKNTQPAIISRIKIISGMNIAEKRVPQDGRINMRVEGLRSISVFPVFPRSMARRSSCVFFLNPILW